MTNQEILSGRTWPAPSRSPLMRMQWKDLLFCHWPLPIAELSPLIPPGLHLDTFDGQAWIGVVPFRMEDVAPRRLPAVPWLSAFPELNVRTYVTRAGKPGVWFFSLDATNPVAVRVARSLFHLKYMDAKILARNEGEWIHFRSRRTHRGEPPAELDVAYRPSGEEFEAQVGTLEDWLTARYCLYVENRRGRILRGEIDHLPWRLQPAEARITDNSMLAWLGLKQPTEPPHLLFARDLRVAAWSNEKA